VTTAMDFQWGFGFASTCQGSRFQLAEKQVDGTPSPETRRCAV